jgi:cation transport ATPase
VFEQFATKDKKLSVAVTQIGEKYHLDIYQAARIILNDLGIKTMSGGNQCTAEQDKDYFSYRRGQKNNMEKKVHLIFSVVMSLFMISIMSFVVTYMNIGWNDQTIEKWLSSFAIAWLVGVPLLYIFAPIFKKKIVKLLSK